MTSLMGAETRHQKVPGHVQKPSVHTIFSRNANVIRIRVLRAFRRGSSCTDCGGFEDSFDEPAFSAFSELLRIFYGLFMIFLLYLDPWRILY